MNTNQTMESCGAGCTFCQAHLNRAAGSDIAQWLKITSYPDYSLQSRDYFTKEMAFPKPSVTCLPLAL